mgnify:CR=1 FL=1
MRVCFDYRVAVKLTQRKKRAASQSCSPNALRAKVDRTFNKRFKSGNSCPKNLTTGRVLRVESFLLSSLQSSKLTLWYCQLYKNSANVVASIFMHFKVHFSLYSDTYHRCVHCMCYFFWLAHRPLPDGSWLASRRCKWSRTGVVALPPP